LNQSLQVKNLDDFIAALLTRLKSIYFCFNLTVDPIATQSPFFRGMSPKELILKMLFVSLSLLAI